jgi:hypothetical protein
VQELRPGLWTWTAAHPSWSDGEPWGPEVRSYAYDTGEALVLFDPISPPSLLEGLVEAQEIGVLLTAAWHRRTADECVERLGAHVFGADEPPPADVERRRTYYEDEVAYWIPRHRALVIGDVFTNEEGFILRNDWLPEGVSAEQMREGLRPLLELPVELVLITHGDPVVEDAHSKLQAALGR